MKLPAFNKPSFKMPSFVRSEPEAEVSEGRFGGFFRVLRRFVLYPTFFLVCLVLFAYLTFPYDRVRDFIVQEVENPRGRGGTRVASGYTLEIVDLQPSWFTGIEATGVQLSQASSDPETPPAQVTFEYIHARIGLLALLFGTQDVTFETRVGGGTIAGEVQLSEETRAMNVEIQGVRMARIGLLGAMAGVPIKGRITGTLEATLTEEASESNGNIELEIEEMVIGDGVAKFRVESEPMLRAGITVPETNFGDVQLQASIEGLVATITKLEGRGEDIELDGAGSVQMRNSIGNSTVDAMLRIGTSETFRSENEGVFLLLDQAPRVRAAKTPEGDALQFHVVGNFGPRLRFQGAGRSPRPGSE